MDSKNRKREIREVCKTALGEYASRQGSVRIKLMEGEINTIMLSCREPEALRFFEVKINLMADIIETDIAKEIRERREQADSEATNQQKEARIRWLRGELVRRNKKLEKHYLAIQRIKKELQEELNAQD